MDAFLAGSEGKVLDVELAKAILNLASESLVTDSSIDEDIACLMSKNESFILLGRYDVGMELADKVSVLAEAIGREDPLFESSPYIKITPLVKKRLEEKKIKLAAWDSQEEDIAHLDEIFDRMEKLTLEIFNINVPMPGLGEKIAQLDALCDEVIKLAGKLRKLDPQKMLYMIKIDTAENRKILADEKRRFIIKP
jgi:hypothetical protein